MNLRFLISIYLCAQLAFPAFGQSWRSSLYPEDWQPGYTDLQNRFLHDFSYAGYHAGEISIPQIDKNIIDVTQPPFNADNSGSTDVTSIIQQAIDSVAEVGCGVVYLPEGTYQINASGTNALWIKSDSIILRGAGIGKTFLLNMQTNMRSKNIILVSPAVSADWYSPLEAAVNFASDAVEMDNVLYLSSVSSFSVGERVVLTTDFTDEFIAEHLMTGKWNSSLPGVAFSRKIISIDTDNNSITIDIPLRYYLKTRDNARGYKVNKPIIEVGLEDFSVGNIQNPLSGWGENDYSVSGTGAYQVHASQAVSFKYAENCWASNIATYRPAANTSDFHLLSNGILLEQSKQVSVSNCDFEKSQYEGGGGNGYMYTLRSNDCLITHSRAVDGRHNYDFKSAYSNGNVIHRCTGEIPRYASDFHMHLSMSNLFDCFTSNGDFLEATYRPYGTIEHGQVTSQSVFWNTRGNYYHTGNNYVVKSEQWGYGYVIGTQGDAPNVVLSTANNTSPQDLLEGMGKGESLIPSSLYEDQLLRRKSGVISLIPEKDSIKNIIKLVNDYWIENNPDPGDNNWASAVYHIGNMAAYNAIGDNEYYQHSKDWAEAHNWEPYNVSRHADHQACGQVYLDFYDLEDSAKFIIAIDEVINSMVVSVPKDDWWWIDAYFMAMPVFIRLGNIMEDTSYYRKMYDLYNDTKATRELYDESTNLWFRDQDFSAPEDTTDAGKKIYWSRGNGWVFAAHALTLNYLPDTDLHHTEYLETFTAMAEELKNRQLENGFWGVNLDDSTDYPGPETSGTSLFIFGMAWGINNGILDFETYYPVVRKALDAVITTSVHDNGLLGYIQGVGLAPSSSQPVTYESTSNFGMGVFLLAASEIYKLVLGTHIPTENQPNEELYNLALNNLYDFSEEQTDPGNTNPATNAVDGSTATRWSAEFYPQWIEIDMKELKTFHITHIVPYQQRAYQYIMEGKRNLDDTYEVIVDQTDNTEGGPTLIDEFDPVTYRYVRLTITGCALNCSNWASILEFRIFGDYTSGFTRSISGDILVNFYPNPAIDYVTITNSLPIKQVKVLDIFARERISIVPDQNSEGVFIGDLEPGIYLLYVIDNQNNTYINKLIKK